MEVLEYGFKAKVVENKARGGGSRRGGAVLNKYRSTKPL